LAIDIVTVTDSQFADLLGHGEGHFLDFKAKEVSPAKLTKARSAFANADGGELLCLTAALCPRAAGHAFS
jgi:ATP-dependent DNA helicase RecG